MESQSSQSYPSCSGLTSLSLGGALGDCGDEDMSALTEALPQLRALNVSGCAQFATDAGASLNYYNYNYYYYYIVII